ncbi:MAG: sulfotransferase [Planctomycetota bacterium]
MENTLDFVVIGAQKAGSTFIMQCLQDHPDIYMPNGETPFFQGPDYSPDRLCVLEEIVRAAKPNQIRGIKRPNYLGEPEVPARISRHFPHIKIIAVLRNPVSRAISAYFHFLRAGHIPLLPVNEGLRMILSHKLDTQYPLSSTILTYGLYDQHVARYAEYFSEEQTKIIVFDDVINHPESSVQDLYRFLGIDEAIVPKRTDDRPMSASYSYSRLRINRFLKPLVYKISPDYSRLYPRPGTGILRGLITGFDRQVLARLFRSAKPVIEDDVQEALKAYYKEDVDHLRNRLNHDLRDW